MTSMNKFEGILIEALGKLMQTKPLEEYSAVEIGKAFKEPLFKFMRECIYSTYPTADPKTIEPLLYFYSELVDRYYLNLDAEESEEGVDKLIQQMLDTGNVLLELIRKMNS